KSPKLRTIERPTTHALIPFKIDAPARIRRGALDRLILSRAALNERNRRRGARSRCRAAGFAVGEVRGEPGNHLSASGRGAYAHRFLPAARGERRALRQVTFAQASDMRHVLAIA